jgi:hypothetical protein
MMSTQAARWPAHVAFDTDKLQTFQTRRGLIASTVPPQRRPGPQLRGHALLDSGSIAAYITTAWDV